MMNNRRMMLAGGLLLLCAFLAPSCSKKDASLPGKRIGTVVVDAAPGSFPVRVSTDVSWRAFSTAPWLEVEDDWMLPRDVCRVDYASNESVIGEIRLSRVGLILFETKDGVQRDTLVVLQKGATPFLSLPASMNVAEDQGDYSLALTSNLPDAARPSLAIRSTQPWIYDLQLSDDLTRILFSVAEGSDRSAEIEAVYTDVFGETTTVSCTINQ